MPSKKPTLHSTDPSSDAGADAVAALPGLGPRSAAMLAAANIRDMAALRQLGAVGAYLAVKNASGAASLNLLWALEGALTGRDWRLVAREDRTRLLLALDDAARGPDCRRT